MATVEIIGQPIQAEKVAATATIEQQFKDEVAKRGMSEQPSVNNVEIDSATLYKTAQQYSAAAMQAEQTASDFAQQAERTAQEVKSLQLQDGKIKRPLGTIETTAAITASVVGGVELLKLADKNIYNPEKVVNQALNATVGAVGKNSNANPMNWINNLVNGSQNVGAMKDGVEAAVTKVSGSKLANAITATTDDLIQAAGIDNATQTAFKQLEKAAAKIDVLKDDKKLFDKAARIVDNLAEKIPDANLTNLYDDITINNSPLVYNKKTLVAAFSNATDGVKQNAIGTVSLTDAVDGDLLGKAADIKDAVVEGAGGFDKLTGIAEQDLREKGGKVAEFVMDSRDKFKNANPKIKMAIVGTVAVGAALAAYFGINAINEQIQKQHKGIEGQIDEAQQKGTAWSEKFEKTKANAVEARTAANTLASWGDRLEQQKQSPNMAMGL